MMVEKLQNTQVAIWIGIVVIVAMVTLIAKCAWCFEKRKQKQEIQNNNKEKIQALAMDTKGDLQKCEKVQLLQKKQKYISPFMFRQSIKFMCPLNKKVIVAAVQPQPKLSNDMEYSVESTRDIILTEDESTSMVCKDTQGNDEIAESMNMDKFDDFIEWTGINYIANMLTSQLEIPESDTRDNQVKGVDCNLGKIQFSLSYDFPTGDLRLTILQAQNLPAKDISGTSDPYVKILLLPNKKSKLFTKIKKRNLNPVWNECFLFEKWPQEKLLNKTIHLKVIDHDRFSFDDPIGEIYIPLYEVDLSHFTTMWQHLQPCRNMRSKLGEILLSLCYQPSLGKLNIIVMKAKDLQIKDITGSSDPYVKMWLKFGTTKILKKRTSIKKRTLTPIFNESFIFDIPWTKLCDSEIEVTVMDFDKIGRNEKIGRVVLSSKSGPLESKHWNDMIKRPRRQVAQWHLLND